MMAPDADETIRQLTAMVNGNNAVTQWVNALENTVLPSLSPTPSWYPQISGALQTSQKSSDIWLTSIGPNIQGEVPLAFINYFNLFSLVVPRLTALMTQIGNNTPPNIPSSDQVTELQEYVQALQQKAKAQLETVKSLRQSISAFRSQLASDHGTLTSALQSALAQETQVSAAIQQVQLQVQALQAAIADLAEKATSDDISAGDELAGLVVDLAFSGGEVDLGDLAIGLYGFVNDLQQGSVETDQVKADIQQLTSLMQQLENDEQQLGMLQGLVATLEKLLELNDAALDTFSNFVGNWSLTVYGLNYLQVVLAQPQIDVSTIPDLNDLSASLTAWQSIGSFATDVQNVIFSQQAQVNLNVQA